MPKSTLPPVGPGFIHRIGPEPHLTGEQYATCDICQRKLPASQMRVQWDGFVACEDDYFPRPWFLDLLPAYPNEGGNTLANPRPKPNVTVSNPGTDPTIPDYLSALGIESHVDSPGWD